MKITSQQTAIHAPVALHFAHFGRKIASYTRAFLIAIAWATAPALCLAQANPTGPNLVGFWYKPTESGWGLSIQQHGATTFAVWFTYDAQAKPTWYALQCSFVATNCDGDLLAVTGAPLAQIVESATHSANITARKVGVGKIAITATNQISLSYTVGAITQTKLNLEPQLFEAPALVPQCSFQPEASRRELRNFTDHWWGGPTASGWGVQISHQGRKVFAGWYAYNNVGNASWMVAQGEQDGDNPLRFIGDVYEIAEGVAFSEFNQPIPPASIANVGKFSLDFSNGERGVFNFTVPKLGLLNRNLAIERFANATGAVTVCASCPLTAAIANTAEIAPVSTPAPSCNNVSAPIAISYGSAPAQKIDLYLPANAIAPYPLVIWIHGGGWVQGSRADMAPARRLLCNGFAVASIDYRLSGSAAYPAQIHDVKAAIRLLRAQAASYQLNPNRFASFGSSAGGHLAALAATSHGVAVLEDLTQGNAAVSSSVQAAVNWYGPTDFSKMDAQLRAQGNCADNTATHGTAASPESMLLRCTVGNTQDVACAAKIASANPISFVSSQTPPMLIMHGKGDCTVPRAQSDILKAALDAAGRCSIKRQVVNAGHGGEAWDSAPVLDVVLQFLNATLKY